MFELAAETERLRKTLDKVLAAVQDPMQYKPHTVIEFADRIERIIQEGLYGEHIKV